MAVRIKQQGLDITPSPTGSFPPAGSALAMAYFVSVLSDPIYLSISLYMESWDGERMCLDYAGRDVSVMLYEPAIELYCLIEFWF